MTKPPRRCPFCGETFQGQKKNFEHIVPNWLVSAADLKRRSMKVSWPSATRNIPMRRIGLSACKACNDMFSSLEAEAKTAFEKIKAGEPITPSDQSVLLDWFDKMRVGIWLWYRQGGRADFKLEPNFHVGQRLGQKDRLLMIKRFPNVPDMRGMSFDGFARAFAFSPSVLGFLIDNISFVSVSNDLIVARNLRDLAIKRTLHDGGVEEIEPVLSSPGAPKLVALGRPSTFGECVMPVEWFERTGIAHKGAAFEHELSSATVARSEIYSFDSSFAPKPEGDIEIELCLGPINANVALANINRANATILMLNEFLNADWNIPAGSAASATMKRRILSYIGDEEYLRMRHAGVYARETGIRLPI